MFECDVEVKFKKCAIVFLLVFLFFGNAQSSLASKGQPLIDSLQKELVKKGQDTSRLSVLYKISFEYSFLDPAKGLRLANEGMKLAEHLKSNKWIAKSNFLIGCNYDGLTDYKNAQIYYTLALDQFRSQSDSLHVGLAILNIGTLYCYKNDFPKALECYYQALELFQQTGNQKAIADVLGNIGNVFYSRKDYVKALEYFRKDLGKMEEANNQLGAGLVIHNIGTLYSKLEYHDSAIKNFKRALEIFKEIKYSSSIANIYVSIAMECIATTDMHSALAFAYSALHLFENGEANDNRVLVLTYSVLGSAHLTLSQGHYKPGKKEETTSDVKAEAAAESAFRATAGENLATGSGYFQQGLRIAEPIQNMELLAPFYKDLATVDSIKKDYKKAYEWQAKYMQAKDSIASSTNSEKILSISMNYDFSRKQLTDSLKSVAILKEQKQLLVRQRTFTYTGLGVGLLLLGFSVVLVRNNKLLDREKKRSDDLLLNILPSEVAQELKDKGSADAHHFDNVTVLFTDFVSFTNFSERVTPQELVMELHTCFKAFDEITSRYKIEKIKTIGDAYLAVSGLPAADANHAENVILAAIEICAFVDRRVAALGERTFKVRIGVHTGPVVAGIVGVKKFAYDIWGDTVNTAARMENNSEPGKINISEATYAFAKDKFRCEYRGEIDVKGKGMMKMYFVG